MGLAAAALLGGGRLTAQGTDGSRIFAVPAVKDSGAAVRYEAAAEMMISDLEHAIQQADTAALTSVLDADAIPLEERQLAARNSCPTAQGTLLSLVRQTKQTAPPDGAPLADIRFDVDYAVHTSAVDSTVVISGRITRRTALVNQYAPIRIVIGRADDTMRERQVVGLLSGLCGMSMVK